MAKLWHVGDILSLEAILRVLSSPVMFSTTTGDVETGEGTDVGRPTALSLSRPQPAPTLGVDPGNHPGPDPAPRHRGHVWPPGNRRIAFSFSHRSQTMVKHQWESSRTDKVSEPVRMMHQPLKLSRLSNTCLGSNHYAQGREARRQTVSSLIPPQPHALMVILVRLGSRR